MTDRYRSVREIGVGGFGVVEVALDTATNTHVAVKHIASDKVHVEAKRLVREIDIMIKLRDKHPNIMTLLDAFISNANPNDAENFDVHLVMPLMRGDLHRFTREMRKLPLHQQNHGPLLRSIAVVFAFHVAFGLDYLHKSGIVHRDLKPDNVLVNVDVIDPYQSVAVIADFGLARAVSPTETFYICTRQYRPPEVITNLAAGNASLDIWSLGCVLYELVTGRTLFHLPTSLENGQWSGAKASFQLEALLDIVGTPRPEEVALMPPCNVKSYLQKTRTRVSQVDTLLDANFRLECDEVEKTMWKQLIASCLEYFPDKRPTAEAVCRCPLFQRYNVVYGENVHQYPAISYLGGSTSEFRLENKRKIRSLIEQTDFQTNPGAVAAASSAAGSPQCAPVVAGGIAFPTLATEAVRARFAQWSIAAESDVQAAIDEVARCLQDTTRAAEEVADLRTLLNYFVALLPIPPTGEDDQVPLGHQQAASRESRVMEDD